MDMGTDHECKSACTYTQIEIRRQLSKNDRLMAAPQEQSNFRFHSCIGSSRASTCYTAASICRELLRLPHGWLGSTPMQRGLVLANLIYILQMEGI